MENMRNQRQPLELQDFGEEEMPLEVWRQYVKQVKESDGFEVDDFSNYLSCGQITPIETFTDRFLELVTPFAELVIAEYNKQKNASFELVKIEKVNTQVVKGVIYFITFTAKDKFIANGATKTFQARVYEPLKGDDPNQRASVELCRLKATAFDEGFISAAGDSSSTALNEGGTYGGTYGGGVCVWP